MNLPAAASTATSRDDCVVEPWVVFSPEDTLQEAASAAVFANEHGYVVLRQVVPRGWVADLKSHVTTSAHARGLLMADGTMGVMGSASLFEDPRWIRLQQDILPSTEFLRVGDAPGLLAVLAKIVHGAVMTRRGDICRIAPPCGALSSRSSPQTTRPHQDSYYMGGTLPIWTAWMPLHACEMDRGGIAIVPRSHKSGLLAHHGQGAGQLGCSIADDVVWHSGDLQPGDALLFHARTIHRAWHNLHPTLPRLSVDFRYQPQATTLPTQVSTVQEPEHDNAF